MNHPTVRQATRVDLTGIEQLLESASLPTLGVSEHIRHFLVAEMEGEIAGAIGLEVYGETALLRSAVVASGLQRTGIGGLLYAQIVEQAKRLAVQRLILLTNTAEKYFERKGFKKIDQKSVTGPITSSVEFTGACPSHAACMELLL
ncbi:MAG TPA: arsenic resistance N-acetyltransferase ArsN2 [Bacteroidota bacterium]|nr:arsenic resistance N-acetyltransferase ArsN2 [Bacteroidota bacterium]